MALSNDLISKFVKVAKNDSNKKKTETTVFGTTVERDGRMWVKLDGSDGLLTPISSTAEVNAGERVTVMVKNHTATITGNMSSPAARTGTVNEVKKVVDQSVSSVVVLYAQGPSSVIAPTEGWSTTAPQWTDGMHVWQKTIATLNTGDTKESDPTCISGANGQNGTPGEPGVPGKDGEDGEDGAPGRSVVGIATQFCITTSKDAKPDNEATWFDTMPDWSEGDYLWIRSEITYANPAGVEYTEPQCDCSWEAVNSVDEKLDKGLEDVQAQVTNVYNNTQSYADKIVMEALKEYTKTSDFVTFKETMTTLWEQDSKSFQATFLTLQERIESVEGTTSSEFAEIKKYIRFEDGNIILGETNNPIVLTIENDEIHFAQNGVKVCYISDAKMGIREVEVTQAATLAGLRFYKASNGSICIN